MDSVATIQKRSVRFKARSFVAFSLSPEAPLDEWLDGLDRWTENSPGFFFGRPVVLDLQSLRPSALQIEDLICQLSERGIRVYAIETDDGEKLGPHLPPLLLGAKTAIVDEARTQMRDEVDETSGLGTLTLHAPVRSGQSIFHAAGDVIVLGSVGSGSEIVAGGSVHVYGTLRGRIFAGATGNPDARIFCRRNEAELLAVDGWYRTADDMDPTSRGKPVQAFLKEGAIQIMTTE